MIPALFSTEEEIIRKIKRAARTHKFENAQTISHIFYDVFKVAYYALIRKKSNLQDKQKLGIPIILKRKEVTKIVKLVDYHHRNDKVFKAQHELMQCFSDSFEEEDALRFFEEFVEGETKDKFGRPIYIDLEKGVKFMYKNYDTGKHEIDSKYYLKHRGKRLPWIRHTLHNTTNLYAKISGKKTEIMYLCKYDLYSGGENHRCYWIVIVKKYKKDNLSPYQFKTAFPIFRYNRLLKRLERYKPITEFPNIFAKKT